MINFRCFFLGYIGSFLVAVLGTLLKSTKDIQIQNIKFTLLEYLKKNRCWNILRKVEFA